MIIYAVRSDASGKIREARDFLMVARRGDELFVPKIEELTPLPAESELFMLPGRRPLGRNRSTGEVQELPGLAVAAFAAPGFTLSATPAYHKAADAPVLPLFAYGAVGFARGRFWICAVQSDSEPRQKFADIRPEQIERNCEKLLEMYPDNRLLAHIINNCVARYDCPAARNFALGRYEAPLPTSQACNARCLGCISSLQQDGPAKVTPQCRLEFTPAAEEIVQIMQIHEGRERKRPIYSFGQGCEGDPLVNSALLARSIRMFRQVGGKGTINCNTNAGRTTAVEELADAGLTSLRVSMNSAQAQIYEAYYRPKDYDFSSVARSVRRAREWGVFVSINLLFFPGLTDTPEELAALEAFCSGNGVSMIQWRNLNMDPDWYEERMGRFRLSRTLGLKKFREDLQKRCPWLLHGYFNPWLGSKARITAPMPVKTKSE